MEDIEVGKPFIQTYLRGQGRFISTARRESSSEYAPSPYYETIVWEWDEKTRELGEIVFTDDSGNRANHAFHNHFAIADKIMNDLPLEVER